MCNRNSGNKRLDSFHYFPLRPTEIVATKSQTVATIFLGGQQKLVGTKSQTVATILLGGQQKLVGTKGQTVATIFCGRRQKV
jgi:hypothetical protein